MKYNSLVTLTNGKEVEVKGEVVVILNSKETNILISALEDYALAHKKSKLAKELLDNFNNVPLS